MDKFVSCLASNEAALIVTTVNRRYLTGFCSSLGYLFLTNKRATLLVDGRYYLAAKQSVENAEVMLLSDTAEQLRELAKTSKIETILLENEITVNELQRFQKIFEGLEVLADGRLDNALSNLRSVKSQMEIESIIAAQRIAEKAFSQLLNFIKVGVSESRIAAELEYLMRLYGSEDKSFDTIAVSGTKSAMPHGVPDEKPLEHGDFLTLDFGAVKNGYHSDMTRTVALGCATDEMIKVYDTVLAAQKAAETTVRNGVRCADVDKAARSVIENAGYGRYFTHSTGHSLGLEVHELPTVSPKSESVLKTGNIITNEPGIYIEDKFGVRIEDMLLVTESGCENLTKCEKSLIIL